MPFVIAIALVVSIVGIVVHTQRRRNTRSRHADDTVDHVYDSPTARSETRTSSTSVKPDENIPRVDA